MSFELDSRLTADTVVVGDWPLCRVLLMNDARYPWLILVPRRPNIREIHELAENDQQRLLSESVRLGRALMNLFAGDKLNVAALGNMVPQLHVHHIVRYADDDAWPAPVWGRHPALPYADDDLRERLELLRATLATLA